MVLQNFGGYNGISYYASETVVSAGKVVDILFEKLLSGNSLNARMFSCPISGFSSGDLGTIFMGAIQVFLFLTYDVSY